MLGTDGTACQQNDSILQPKRTISILSWTFQIYHTLSLLQMSTSTVKSTKNSIPIVEESFQIENVNISMGISDW
jgi:hypothetical protein